MIKNFVCIFGYLFLVVNLGFAQTSNSAVNLTNSPTKTSIAKYEDVLTYIPGNWKYEKTQFVEDGLTKEMVYQNFKPIASNPIVEDKKETNPQSPNGGGNPAPMPALQIDKDGRPLSPVEIAKRASFLTMQNQLELLNQKYFYVFISRSDTSGNLSIMNETAPRQIEMISGANIAYKISLIKEAPYIVFSSAGEKDIKFLIMKMNKTEMIWIDLTSKERYVHFFRRGDFK